MVHLKLKLELSTVIIGCIFLSACSEYDGKEYFCEGYWQNGNARSYGQNAVRINNEEICITYLDRDYDKYQCIRFGKEIYGEWVSNQGGDGQIEERTSFSSKFESGKALVQVRRQERPGKAEFVERKLINNNWNFFYKDIPLNLPLPKSLATEDNLLTFDLYAVSNVVYSNGRMIGKPYSKELADILGPSDQQSYGVGGDTFKAYYDRANNALVSTYIFDTNTSTLGYDSKYPHRYQCAFWKKQRWWEL